MAEVFASVNGEVIQRFIALTKPVQDALESAAQERARVAESLLNSRAKRRTGASRITVHKGDIDRYVTLDDTAGRGAANVIEFGRPGPDDESEEGAVAGLYVLTDAFDLPRY